MKILQNRQTVESIEHRCIFQHEDCPGAGFSFDCDQSGKVDESSLPAMALNSFAACLTGAVRIRKNARCDREGNLIPDSGQVVLSKVVDKGVQSFPNVYTSPAIGQCECGEEVCLSGFTNTCQCGLDYNMSGQLLGPRSQWGEETGESLSDILSIP